jgi:hypothetical protein
MGRPCEMQACPEAPLREAKGLRLGLIALNLFEWQAQRPTPCNR